MSCKSTARDVYFAKNIKSQTTPEGYLVALRNSPYRLHRRWADTLSVSVNDLKLQLEQLKGATSANPN